MDSTKDLIQEIESLYKQMLSNLTLDSTGRNVVDDGKHELSQSANGIAKAILKVAHTIDENDQDARKFLKDRAKDMSTLVELSEYLKAFPEQDASRSSIKDKKLLGKVNATFNNNLQFTVKIENEEAFHQSMLAYGLPSVRYISTDIKNGEILYNVWGPYKEQVKMIAKREDHLRGFGEVAESKLDGATKEISLSRLEYHILREYLKNSSKKVARTGYDEQDIKAIYEIDQEPFVFKGLVRAQLGSSHFFDVVRMAKIENDLQAQDEFNNAFKNAKLTRNQTDVYMFFDASPSSYAKLDKEGITLYHFEEQGEPGSKSFKLIEDDKISAQSTAEYQAALDKFEKKARSMGLKTITAPELARLEQKEGAFDLARKQDIAKLTSKLPTKKWTFKEYDKDVVSVFANLDLINDEDKLRKFNLLDARSRFAMEIVELTDEIININKDQLDINLVMDMFAKTKDSNHNLSIQVVTEALQDYVQKTLQSESLEERNDATVEFNEILKEFYAEYNVTDPNIQNNFNTAICRLVTDSVGLEGQDAAQYDVAQRNIVLNLVDGTNNVLGKNEDIEKLMKSLNQVNTQMINVKEKMLQSTPKHRDTLDRLVTMHGQSIDVPNKSHDAHKREEVSKVLE